MEINSRCYKDKEVMDRHDTINHLQFSLKNVQDNIHFVDKKVGAAVTIMAAALGFVVPKEFVGGQILTAVSKMNFFFSIDVLILLVALVCVIFFCVVNERGKKLVSCHPPQ